MAKTPKKTKVKKTRITSISVREAKKRDLSPSWEGQESWSAREFLRAYHDAMQFYNLDFDEKKFKPNVLDWMKLNGYAEKDITAFKKSKDWRCTSTMGAIACCLLKGMPAKRSDFNGGKSSADWLKSRIADVINQSREDVEEEVPKTVQPSIQDRVRDVAITMSTELDDAVETFIVNPKKFNPKSFKVSNILKKNEVKAAHAKIIQSFYQNDISELTEVIEAKDEQLKEAYKKYTKIEIKNLLQFYQEIADACNMIMQESKVNRKPRAKKPVAKDKLVSKLKYKKTDETLKLVSINPTDIIGCKELWCFDTKTRKIFKYIAAEYSEITIKGTSLVGFDENKSIGKTLRKPAEQLAEFKKAGKVALRSFMENISTMEIKGSGRINENIILLKTQL